MIHDLRYANFPIDFARERLGFTPDPWQAQVLASRARRVILNCCRQSGKSTTAALLALHRALFTAGALVLVISPSLRQSSELFRKVRDFLRVLDPPVREATRLSVVFPHGGRIVALPGAEATVRGFSAAQLIIEDEAARVGEELHRAMRPMLATTNGQLILMSTPRGSRGHFYHAWGCEPHWEKIEIHAGQCPRITATYLESERRSLAENWFRQEFEGLFIPREDQLFSLELIQKAIRPELEAMSFRNNRWYLGDRPFPEDGSPINGPKINHICFRQRR